MITKAYKFLTPSLSKNDSSFYGDWSNQNGDGTRIFEVFNGDLTGHPSFTMIRITRDTEEEVEDELYGQMSDGYFENYMGDLKYKEINPDSIRLKGELMQKAVKEIGDTLTSSTLDGETKSNIEGHFMVILRALSRYDTLKAIQAADREVIRTRCKLNKPGATDKDVAAHDKAVEDYFNIVKDAIPRISDTLKWKRAEDFLLDYAALYGEKYVTCVEDTYEYENGLMLIVYESKKAMQGYTDGEKYHICINVDDPDSWKDIVNDTDTGSYYKRRQSS